MKDPRCTGPFHKDHAEGECPYGYGDVEPDTLGVAPMCRAEAERDELRALLDVACARVATLTAARARVLDRAQACLRAPNVPIFSANDVIELLLTSDESEAAS